MKQRLAAIAAALALGACPTLAGCADDTVATACEGQTLKIGHSTGLSLIYAPLYIAEKKGYTEDEKLTMKHLELGGGSESIQALVGGSIDLVATPFASVASAAREGAPIVAFASLSNRNTADIGIKTAHAPPASADANAKIKALKGLRVGVTSPGSATDQTLRYLAVQAGLDPERDLKITATGGAGETVAAFSRGSIDAYLIGPPASGVAARQGGGVVMLRLSEGQVPELNDTLYGVMATSRRTLKNKEPLMRCYARALGKANRFINEHPDEAGELLRQDFADMSDQEYDETWKAMVASTPPTSAIHPEEAEKAADFLAVVTGRDELDVSAYYTQKLTGDQK